MNPNGVRTRVRHCLIPTISSLVVLGAAGTALAHEPGDLAVFRWSDSDKGTYQVHADGSPEEKLYYKTPYFSSNETHISPNGKKVAFNGGSEFYQNIFVVDFTTEKLTQLTKGNNVKEHPSWSPNARKIVADCGGQLCVMKSNGEGRPRKVTTNKYSENSPEWSPDGNRIVYDTDRGLMTIKPDGSRRRRLTYKEFDSDPIWSPDGEFIAFIRYKSGGSKIYRIKPDGAGLKKIAGAPSKYDEEHEWAPDGSRLVFVRTDHSDDPKEPSCSTIRTIRPNGEGTRKLTDCFLHGGFGLLSPVWSPDSERIAYTARHVPGPGMDPVDAVFSIKRDGSDRQVLTHETDTYASLFGLDW